MPILIVQAGKDTKFSRIEAVAFVIRQLGGTSKSESFYVGGCGLGHLAHK